MGIRIDKVEAEVRNNTATVQDTRAEMRTVRTLWNAVTIAMFLGMVTLFIWLDGKSDDKFDNLMKEIKESNSQVHARITEVNTNLTAELVKINHAIHAINHDHEKLKK